MRHLILAAYAALAATGFAGLASLAFLYARTRRPLVALIAAVEASLLAGLALTLAAFYLRNVASYEGPGGGTVMTPLGIASLVLQASIYLFVFLSLGRLEPGSGAFRALRAAARSLALANVLVPAAYLFLAADALFREAPIPPDSLGSFGYLLTGGAVAMAGLAFLLARLADEPPSVRLLARGLGLCCLAFVPLTVAEALLAASGSWPYKPLSLDFLFYLGMNAVSCASLAASLSRDRSPAFAPPTAEAASALGLTEREQAMAELIGRGLSNKEIAAELGISPATVRTHIYNLYRKAGARSRVELLNILSRR